MLEILLELKDEPMIDGSDRHPPRSNKIMVWCRGKPSRPHQGCDFSPVGCGDMLAAVDREPAGASA
jgi:hypothetical protein